MKPGGIGMCMAATLGFQAMLGCATAPQQEAESGFVPLFNGRNLDGWVVEPKPEAMAMYGVEGGTEDSFAVKDGLLVRTSGGYSYIRTIGTYDDFILKLEYRIPRDGNSGVHVRIGDAADEVNTGIEMQILGDYGAPPDIHSSGAIYDLLAPRENATHPDGEWNEAVIACQGSWIHIDLNGRRIVDMNLDEWTEPKGKFPTAYARMPRCGYIGLQNHGTPVAYRNIRVKRLPAATAKP